MLIVDSERAKIHDAQIRRELTQSQISQWLQNEAAENVRETDNLSVDEQVRHLGKPLTWHQFEAKLQKLNPAITFIWLHDSLICPHRKIVLNGKEMDGLTYPSLLMPERSIWRVEEEEVPDECLNGRVDHSFKVPDVSDYGATEWVPMEGFEHLWEPGGRGIGRWAQVDPTIKPGWTKRRVRWGEAIRGWRTVLVRGVERGLWTPWQVETEFSVLQSPEWQRYMGRTSGSSKVM